MPILDTYRMTNIESCWQLSDSVPINLDKWDFSWKPSPYDPPFIHQFGTQWQSDGGPRYIVDGATQIKYHEFPKAEALPNIFKWKFLYDDIDLSSFDWSWHPSEFEPYTHVFGSKYYRAEEMPCIEYVGKIEQKKYRNELFVNFKKPVDIVFMSNGEVCEQTHYDRLCSIVERDVKWVRGVNGRDRAIKRCAEISDTEWVIVFPAKLWVNENFPFDWQPNRAIDKKHYIFYASNPVNGLCYGHMAPVAYNCEIVKNTTDYTLDFTMRGSHDIIPFAAGVARWNVSPLITWRTAFREVIKLKRSTDDGDMEAKERLTVWLTIAHGDFSDWSIRGGKDAINYYEQVSGCLDKLKLSFSWEWLDSYAKQLGYKFE